MIPSRDLAIAASLVLCTAAAAPPAIAASTGDIEPRILAQEGLAIALASTVLQSQIRILFDTLEGSKRCSPLSGGGSTQVISVKKVSKTVTDSSVTVYFDSACKTPYIKAAATVTTSRTAGSLVDSVTETARYVGLRGQTLGSLSLSESATLPKGAKNLVLIGLGKFTPASGAQVVDLGLTCTLPQAANATTTHCEGGVAQAFPALSLSLASVTPLTLTEQKVGKSRSVSFAGKASDMRTGAAGSLSITMPSGDSLGIGGNGSPYGSVTTKGFAAQFALFPPTPTHWEITDSAHDARFMIQVVSNTTRASRAMVTTISSGAALATIAADQSGTGTISYADGSKAAVTSWLLAD